jgi:predicted nucleic acid-binding protein
MTRYYDSAVLVKLYVCEAHSQAALNLIVAARACVPLNRLQELEIFNALRLKAFRGDISADETAAAVAAVAADLRCGRLYRPALDWGAVFAAALELSAANTLSVGCRSLDVLHVAAALAQNCREFVSMDDRQIRVAAAAGLTVIDLRACA